MNLRQRARTLRVSVVMALVALVAVACGGDSADTTTTAPAPPDSTTTTEAAPEDTTTTEAPAEAIEVGAVDFAFTDLPASVPAGTQFTLRNDSEEELHEFVAFRLDDDETRSVAEILALPPEEAFPILGHAITVLLALPAGGDMIPAVGDGTLDEPGRYAIICVIPTGVDPMVYLAAAAESEGGPPEIEGAGPPHIVHGMFAELTVSG